LKKEEERETKATRVCTTKKKNPSRAVPDYGRSRRYMVASENLMEAGTHLKEKRPIAEKTRGSWVARAEEVQKRKEEGRRRISGRGWKKSRD